MSDYTPGSTAFTRAAELNRKYTELLDQMENAFNGSPDSVDEAIGTMFVIKSQLNALLSTPIHEGGDPDIGPNAGPTYDFTQT